MMENITLYAQLINHGQSEIWLGADGKELTQRRRLATNEVLNVTRRHCDPSVFETFYADYHKAIGHVASLAPQNMDELAVELKLKTPKFNRETSTDDGFIT
jgi:hypothetical protein